MMRLIVNLFTWLVINTGSVLTVHQIEDCSLLPSELGPDWYKVSRPVPQGNDGKPAYKPSYIHMPCAKTTVFDLGVCGCTSLMSFIFTSVNRRKQIHHKLSGDKKVDPGDFIKRVDETTTPRPQVGSLLINTRTGEVKECPFRASSRGPRWYLIREPRDQWRHMICAAGTVFEKRRCTCVHKLMQSREPDKPEDANIIILDDDWTTGDKTISQSLGISVADVDFSADRRTDDIPFWRRQDLFGSDQKEERRIFNGKSDVTVTLHNQENDHKETRKSLDKLDIGEDEISAVHKDMLIKGSRGPMSQARTKLSPLVLDSNLNNRFDIDNNLHSDGSGKSLLMHSKMFDTKKPKVKLERKVMDTNDILNVLDQISTKIDSLKEVKGIAIKNIGDDDEAEKSRKEVTEVNEQFEKIFYKAECSKKPVPELGPQFFLLNVMNLGYIPFTCHGNAIYSDNLCACIPAKDDIAYDEDSFPGKECSKRPIPDLGSQYFLDYLHDVGYIPYVCHKDMIYDDRTCACV